MVEYRRRKGGVISLYSVVLFSVAFVIIIFLAMAKTIKDSQQRREKNK
jgi:hypothetical protein